MRAVPYLTIVDVLGIICQEKIEVHMPKPSDLLQGTLDLLILKSLLREPLHGWGISKRILQLSDDVLSVQQGSLYPALHRLELRGLLSAEWGLSENNRRAKYYKLTARGRKVLEAELTHWNRMVAAIGRVIKPA